MPALRARVGFPAQRFAGPLNGQARRSARHPVNTSATVVACYREYEMTKPALCAFILLASFCADSRAASSVTGTITTSPVTITLTDLDPTDGITPSISFMQTLPVPDDPRVPRVLAGFTDGRGDEFGTRIVPADGSNPLSVSLTYGDRFSAAATLTDPGQFETQVLRASSSAAGPAHRGAFAGAESGFYAFVLSPNTAVTIEMGVHLSGHADAGPDNSYVFFGAELDMLVGGAGGLGSYGDSLAYFLMVQSTVSDVDMYEVLTAAYANRGSNPVTGSLELAASTHARYIPSSIPEPATLPTMAVGLGLIALWARRAGARRATRC